MAEAFSLAAVTPSSGGPQSAGLSINVVPLVDGTPTVCLHTHLRYRDRSGHEELLKAEGRIHSLEPVLLHPRYQSLCTTKSRILLFQLNTHTHTLTPTQESTLQATGPIPGSQPLPLIHPQSSDSSPGDNLRRLN